MPKERKRQVSDSDSDSGPDDRGPAVKKPTPSAKDNKKSEGEEPSFSLGKMKFVKVREFKGKTYIDIREYYEKNGDILPGKKGISLSVEQYQKLKETLPKVDEALSEL